MRFDWQNSKNELKALRSHNTKDFPHPTEQGKRIKIQYGGLLHAYTDKGFEDIDKELPNYSFPEAKELTSVSSNYFIMNLPAWGTVKVENGGKVVRVFDKKNVSIFRYSNPIVIEKGKAPYKIIDEKGKKVIDAYSRDEPFDILEESLVNSDDVDEGTYEVIGNALYIKLPPTLKNNFPLQAYDATDTASTNNGDTFLYQDQPTTNYGTSVAISLGERSTEPTTDHNCRGIFDWTLSSGSGTISLIKLYAYCYYYNRAITVNVHELSQASALVEAEATWSIWKTGSSWATPGGDYSGTVVDTTSISGIDTWFSWVLQGAGATNPIAGLTWESNFDLLLKEASDVGGTTVNNVYSKNNASNRPYIEITYTAAVDYPISTTSSLSLSTSLSRTLAFDRGLSPDLSLAASVSRVFGRLRSTSSNLSLAPSISRALAYARATSSNLSLAVTIAKVWGRTITTATNLSLTTSISRAATWTRASSSNLTLAVTVARSRARTIATSSALSLTTTISLAKGFVRATTSNLSLTANVAKSWGRTITTSASLSLATTISRAVTWARATSSNLSLSVAIATGQQYLVELTTNLSLSVNVAKSWGRTIATSSALSLAASITRVKGFVITTVSNLSLAPTISRAVAWTRATSSNLSLTAAVARSWARIITTSASLSLTTTISRVVAWGRASSPGLTLATTVLSWVAVGRQLVIKILTAQYRAIEVSTSQHRIISAITSLLRKIKILTLGD